MNPRPESLATALPSEQVHVSHEPTTAILVPIEVQMDIPTWIMRDPGPAVEIEDDQCDWL